MAAMFEICDTNSEGLFPWLKAIGIWQRKFTQSPQSKVRSKNNPSVEIKTGIICILSRRHLVSKFIITDLTKLIRIVYLKKTVRAI